MSCRPCDSEKLKKKSKKSKHRPSVKRTQKSPSQGKDLSTKCSKDVEPPATIVRTVNTGGLKWNQEKPRENEPYEKGDYSKMPHEAPNEVNFIGGIGGNIGHRRSKNFINRTTKIQQIYNMRNDNKTIFNFCEDPRSTNNVLLRRKVNAYENDKKFVQDIVRKIGAIKHEQLQITEMSDLSTEIEQTSKSITNSHSNYKDEQIKDNKERNLEIRKQFLAQKRILTKQHYESQVPTDIGFKYRKEKFKLSEYYDVDKNIPEETDIESIREVNVDWTENYRVDSHECDLKFGRPMPEVIAMPMEREKLAFLTRTLDKPKNIERLDQSLEKYSKPIEESVTKDFPYRETARELEKILNKQRVENRSIEMALKDFDQFMYTAGVFDVCESKEDENKTTEPSRQERTKVAMKTYEEKILQQLSEPDEITSDTVDEPLQSKENIQSYRKQSLSKKTSDHPIDFTHAFDVGRNKKLKDVKYPDVIRTDKDKGSTLTDLDVHQKNSKSELNGPSMETIEKKTENTRSKDDQENVKEKCNKNVKGVKKIDSFCTNFTDDSGSFIIVQGKQLHLDHITPLKKTSEMKTGNVTKHFDEYHRPYEVLPIKQAKELNKRDSKLVPSFDIKDRLKVDVPQYDTELIGVKNRKYISQLATEWDEYYQKEILNRPRIRRFKPRTIVKQIVDSLRLKYESIHKREYLTEKLIIIEQEKLFTKRAEEFRDFCMSFFSNLTTTNYRQSMAKIQDLRPMYELNDKLTSELTVVSNKLIQLKTAIIRAEGKFREKTILQNVSYLMKELNWREKNDWIHKRSDGSLETIKESIENRMTTNLRKRDNDSVWTIKEFFENNIFNNRRPALVCFESPDAINDTIVNFKVQLYLSLLKLDLSTWTLINLKHAYNSYRKWSKDFIEQRKKYVEARCSKKYFLDVCAKNMKKDAVQLINGKLVETFSEKTLRILEPLCNTLFLSVIPKNVQEQLEGGDILSKFRTIIAHAMKMLEQLDAIPSTKRKEIEKNIRKENGFIERRTKRAVDLETHIDKVRKVMIKHSTPPFKRPPRTGKLPRSQLPMPKPKLIAKIIQPDEDLETVRLTITEHDFAKFLQESPPQNDFYLDATFFGGDIDVPNIDFLPEMKSNIDEFIVDVKNVLQKWEHNKQGRYLEDAHLAWTTNFGKS